MSNLDNVKFDSKPTLKKPIIVCGLHGSFNNGNASIGVVDYLIDQYDAEKFAELPAARYHIYQMPGGENLRPTFRMENGLIKEAHFPRNEFFYATVPGSDHDLLLLQGIEPNMNWEEYADAVVSVAREFGAARLYSFAVSWKGRLIPANR